MSDKASLSPGWEERFRALDGEGRSLREIAAAFGVSTKSVSRWRSRLGLTKEPPAVPRPQSDRDRAAALLDDGCSFSEAARSLGVAPTTIARWFPDRKPWTPVQSGEFSSMIRWAGRGA